jgi:hypothetical protein
MHERKELPGIQRLAFRIQLGLQRVGQRQVHVVAAEQDVLADADALQLRITGDVDHGDQAEICGTAADVAHQDDVAGRDGIAPLPASLRRPGVERGLRFLQQHDLAQTGGLGRFRGQAARYFVEGRGNRQHDLAVRQVPVPALLVDGVKEGLLQVLQVAGRALEG